MELKINKELFGCLPVPTGDELELLESSIISEGIRDAFVVMPDGTIVDGMNRFALAKKNRIDIPKPVIKPVPTLSHSKIWILKNQLGRRNLISAQRIAAAEMLAKENAGIDPSTCVIRGASLPLTPPIVENTARLAGVSSELTRPIQTW